MFRSTEKLDELKRRIERMPEYKALEAKEFAERFEKRVRLCAESQRRLAAVDKEIAAAEKKCAAANERFARAEIELRAARAAKEEATQQGYGLNVRRECEVAQLLEALRECSDPRVRETWLFADRMEDLLRGEVRIYPYVSRDAMNRPQRTYDTNTEEVNAATAAVRAVKDRMTALNSGPYPRNLEEVLGEAVAELRKVATRFDFNGLRFDEFERELELKPAAALAA